MNTSIRSDGFEEASNFKFFFFFLVYILPNI